MIGSTLHNPSIRLGTSQQNGNKLLPFQDHQGRGGGGGRLRGARGEQQAQSSSVSNSICFRNFLKFLRKLKFGFGLFQVGKAFLQNCLPEFC